MDALGDWLKQIIMVILLATFIDMFMPNRSMQRYVKLVVSLFILLTMLSPVMNWFGTNVNLRVLAAAVDGFRADGGMRLAVDGEHGPAEGTAVPALGEVLSKGEELARERTERSLSLLETELAALVEEHVRTRHGTAAKATAEVRLDEQGWPEIRSIRIRVGTALNRDLEEEETAMPEDAGEVRTVVAPVAPVVVEPVRIGGDHADSAASASAVAPVSPEVKRSIAESVAQMWNVPKNRIVVE